MQTFAHPELGWNETVEAAPPPHRAQAGVKIEQGGRDNAITRMAGAMRRHGMARDVIEAALLAHNEQHCDPPLPDEDVRRIARSISKKAPAPELANYPLTDSGNGERFAAVVAGEYCYCPEQHEWMRWDSRGVWLPDSGGIRATNRAKFVARSLLEYSASVNDKSVRDSMAGWALASESQRGVTAMLGMARSEPGIHRCITDFDADPWVLNCENGMLDLRTGALSAHDTGRLCSRLAAVRYVPGATHPALERYLASVFSDNPPLRDFMARALGYSLTGDTAAESLFLVIGEGGSGKTTLVESFKNMLGTYAVTISGQTLLRLKARGGGPRNDVAALVGRRFAAASEIAKGEALDQELVKSLTGGERVTARFLHKEFFDFQPIAKFWLAANDAPSVSDDDTGAWRRLHRIPFKPLPEGARDPELKRTLLTDPAARSALLSWALAGCMDWQKRGGGRIGLDVPEQVVSATQAYRQEGNPLTEFMEEVCEIGADRWCKVSALREAYTRWCKGGLAPLSHRDFNRRLVEMGCQRGSKCLAGAAQKVWTGLSLVSDGQGEYL